MESKGAQTAQTTPFAVTYKIVTVGRTSGRPVTALRCTKKSQAFRGDHVAQARGVSRSRTAEAGKVGLSFDPAR